METITIQKTVDTKAKELVTLLSTGLPVRVIAKQKRVSEKSVVNQVEQLKKDFDCANTVSLVAFFLRNGLIQ